MGQLARGVAYRARSDGRQNRLGWLLLIAGVNLALWSGVIVLVTHAT